MKISRLPIPFFLIACFVILALTYARAMPPFEASDEAAHFLYVHHLLENRALPVIASREEIAARDDLVERWSIENHQPPLYYAIGTLLVSWTRRDDIEDYLRPNELIFIRGITQDNHNKWLHDPNPPKGDTHLALWGMRLYSLTLAVSTLWLIYLSARIVMNNTPLRLRRGAGGEVDFPVFTGRGLGGGVALTALFLVLSMPTFIAISGSANNDNLVTLLYTAGVYWSLRTWRDGISRSSIFALSAILAAIALTKITGLGLFAVVYGALVFGVLEKRYTPKQAALVIGFSLASAAIFAGWWYLRNWSLYGDPLALQATGSLWGREYAVATESGDILGEISRVWRSLWMMMGHLHNPVWGPVWFYLYVTGISIIGLLGCFYSFFSLRSLRLGGSSFILLLAIVIPIILLAIGTRNVDISYGRLLFPALVGFAPLLILGWRRIFGRFTPLLIIPIIIVALMTPFRELSESYPRLEMVESIPENAVPINVSVDGLTISAYESRTDTLNQDGYADFWLYLRGTNAQNPALFATLLDPITNEALGKAAVYPGNAPTDSLIPDQIYRAPLRIFFDPQPSTLSPQPSALSPRRLKLQLGWQTMLSTDYLPLTRDGAPLESLVVDAATLIDSRYSPPAPQITTAALFTDFDRRDAISLEGYTLLGDTVAPGESLNLTLHWRFLNRMGADYVVTTQLLDADGAFVTQDDGDVPGYPTSAWRAGPNVLDSRELIFPADMACRQGTYQIVVGWYRLEDGQRLDLKSAHTSNRLFILPTPIKCEVG